MCRSHGVESAFGSQAWTASARTPLFYPDAVTLAPNVDADGLLMRIDSEAAGASVKDSFADLDLTGAGFDVLFEAQWIHRPASADMPRTAPDLRWDVARSPESLRDWALAWDGGAGNANLFRPDLLDEPATFVLVGRTTDGCVVAGAVASRSERVVGVSNLFAPADRADMAWPGALQLVGRLCPGLPVVGYERDEDLAFAIRHRFEPIGPLRVWRHR